MRNGIFILITFLQILSFNITQAQDAPLKYEILTTDLAASTENKYAIRDKYGFLWVGTSSGLCCFDGNGKSVYRNQSGVHPATSRFSINSVFESDDDIWFSTNNGLFVFNRHSNSISRFMAKTKYGVTINTSVGKIHNVGKNRVWIITQGQGFFIYDKTDGSLHQDSRHASYYSDITQASDSLIHLASIRGHIQSFRPNGEFVSQTKLPGYISAKNMILMVAARQNIWIAAGTSIYRMSLDSGVMTHIDTGKSIGVVNSLITPSDGTLLLGAANGIWSYDMAKNIISKSIFSDSKYQSDFNQRISSMWADKGGEIIVIHPSGPLDFMIPQDDTYKFINVSASQHHKGYNSVRALAPSSDGNGLWIGTDAGLAFYNVSTEEVSTLPIPGGFNDAVTTLLTDGLNLWIGTENNGLFNYESDTRNVAHHTYDENVPYTVLSNRINNLYKARDGRLHILTDFGLSRYDSIACNFPQLTDFAQQTNGLDMKEDHNGGTWVTTLNNGLFYKAPGGPRFELCADPALTTMSALYFDRHNRLWATSKNKGLFLLNDKSNDWERIDIPVLNNKTPVFITEDGEGNIWTGSNDILVKNDSSGNYYLYSFPHDRSKLPVHNSVCMLPGGIIALGCRDGVLLLNIKKLESFENLIKVYPASLSFPAMDNDSDELKNLGLDKLLYTTAAVDIPYRHNTFTINLSATRPLVAPDVSYDYMLEGVDKSWIEGNSSSEITYNNVPPGKYRFLLKPNGVKDNHISELFINVLPPWYLTPWAICIYVFAFVAFCIGIYVLSRYAIRRKYRKRLHDMKIQNEREVFEAKMRYFVDLVHEIRTPLMLISLPLERLTEKLNQDIKAVNESNNMQYVKSMQRNIDYLLGITNQLLDFRKVENSNGIQLNLSKCNLNRMISNIANRFEEPMRVSGKELDVVLPEKDIVATVDADKTERLLMNLIGNAMKYARHKVVVSIEDSRESDGTAVLRVADDGPGVPMEERERIFDTYYQIGNDNIAASLGTGLGLAYAKLIATAHKGEISVSDSPQGGALFTIKLPKGSDITVKTDETALTDANDTVSEEGNDAPGSVAVLLVEDNDDLREMIADGLTGRYKVLTATDGAMALEVLAENQIDIIVSDVMMPRMDGTEFCTKVKSDVNYSHIPFIILTAKTDTESHEEGLKCGADQYLEKPFPIKQLRLIIGNMLRTRQQFYERIKAVSGSETKTTETEQAIKGLNRMDAEFIERMDSIIIDSINHEDFSIDGLADKLNMSRSSFYRKITGVTGMTPSDYLKNFRLNRAAELLCEGCRATEVSDRTGFTSASYFAKCFKEKFGVLPSEYMSSLSSRTSEDRH